MTVSAPDMEVTVSLNQLSRQLHRRRVANGRQGGEMKQTHHRDDGGAYCASGKQNACAVMQQTLKSSDQN
jgi:hypothetical protein